MTPTLGNGKICYVEMPALDVRRSAEFYERVFGWGTRTRGDGSTAFDDAEVAEAGGEVLGEPMEIPGHGLYVSFFDTEGNRVSMMQPTAT
jgi:predicted enzyme related to lactoylglutathione lyase